jgi:hypothetical protein
VNGLQPRMELFRWKNVSLQAGYYKHQFYSCLFREQHCCRLASLIRGMSGDCLSVMDSTCYINKGILCIGINDVHKIIGNVLGLHISIIICTEACDMFIWLFFWF